MKLACLLVLAAYLFAPIGPDGLKALGELTGLEICEGVYCYADEGRQVAVIAVGKDKESGIVWEVWGTWSCAGFVFALCNPRVPI